MQQVKVFQCIAYCLDISTHILFTGNNTHISLHLFHTTKKMNLLLNIKRITTLQYMLPFVTCD